MDTARVELGMVHGLVFYLPHSTRPCLVELRNQEFPSFAFPMRSQSVRHYSRFSPPTDSEASPVSTLGATFSRTRPSHCPPARRGVATPSCEPTLVGSKVAEPQKLVKNCWCRITPNPRINGVKRGRRMESGNW